MDPRKISKLEFTQNLVNSKRKHQPQYFLEYRDSIRIMRDFKSLVQQKKLNQVCYRLRVPGSWQHISTQKFQKHSLLVSWEVEGGWGTVAMVVLFTVREIFVLLAVIRLCLQCRFLYTKPALKKKRHYLLKQKRNFLFVVFENTFSAAAKLKAI